MVADYPIMPRPRAMPVGRVGMSPVGLHKYDEYGTCTNYDHDPTDDRSFTGKRLDEDSGLYYFQRRWYSPLTGRFISRDLFGADNPFVYVDNRPFYFVDPWGLCEEDFWEYFRKWVANELLHSHGYIVGGGMLAIGGYGFVVGGGALLAAPEPIATKILGGVITSAGLVKIGAGMGIMGYGMYESALGYYDLAKRAYYEIQRP